MKIPIIISVQEDSKHNFQRDLLGEGEKVSPENLNVYFVPRRLIRPYTRREILNASPDDLRKMSGIKD